eukprot:scaffold62556_cov69-Phaeocystis_antarctica.AAC.1
MLLAFSPLDNAGFLFTPSPAARKFTALEGIRTLSMLWIILAHTLNFFNFVGTDEPVAVVYSQTFGAWPFQAVCAANLTLTLTLTLHGGLGRGLRRGHFLRALGLPRCVRAAAKAAADWVESLRLPLLAPHADARLRARRFLRPLAAPGQRAVLVQDAGGGGGLRRLVVVDAALREQRRTFALPAAVHALDMVPRDHLTSNHTLTLTQP